MPRFHRIIERLRSPEWSSALIEFVAVVFGVYLGIEAANWNEARLERQEEAGIRKALRADFLETRKEINGYMEIELAQAYYMAVVEDALITGTVSPRNEQPFREGLLSMVYSMPPPKVSGVLEGLMSSSGLAKIEDRQLRTDLVRYKTAVEQTAQQTVKFEELLRSLRIKTDFAIDYAPPPMAELRTFTVPDSASLKDAEGIYVRFRPSIQDYDLAAMSADPQVRQTFAEARDIHVATVFWAMRLRDQADAVLKRLDEID